MSVATKYEVDWEIWDSQFRGGGNSGDDDGNFGDGLPDEPGKEPSPVFVICGVLGGFTSGLAVGMHTVSKVDQYTQNQAISAHPSQKAAIEQGLYPTDNGKAEIAAVVGPIVLLTVVGAAIGKKLENRFSK